MDLSRPNAISASPQPRTVRLTTLPPELLLVIIELLPHKDQQTFCLLSQLSRQLALPSAFRTLKYSRKLACQLKKFNEARGDVKAAVRELSLADGSFESWDYKLILFPCLRSLPNLHSFEWTSSSPLSNSQRFDRLVASLQHCPLEHFTYGSYLSTKGTIIGPPRLKSLAVKVHHAQVYNLIKPSFSTLVELTIYGYSVIDLVLLRPVGRTLRLFAYGMDGFDLDVLDTIPDVFPHLTTLALIVHRTTQDLQ